MCVSMGLLERQKERGKGLQTGGSSSCKQRYTFFFKGSWNMTELNEERMQTLAAILNDDDQKPFNCARR